MPGCIDATLCPASTGIGPEIVFAGLFLIGASVWLLKLVLDIRNRRREQPFVQASTGTPVKETKAGKLFATVGLKNTCPDCGSKGFYEGPSGGMSTNIFCVNRECRSGFNITWFSQSQGICDRISQDNIERYPAAEKTIA